MYKTEPLVLEFNERLVDFYVNIPAYLHSGFKKVLLKEKSYKLCYACFRVIVLLKF